MNLIALLSLFIFGLMIFGSIAIYVIITAPVALPYIQAKLSKGMVIILQTQSGKREIIATNRHFKNKKYGSFLPTEDSTFLINGVPVALGHVDISVIPTKAATEAAQKLEEADAEVYTTLEDSAEAALTAGIIDKYDARALYRYSANVTPNYVNSRIEHKVAEILASNRNDIGKLFNYAIIFMMIMIAAGVAYSMTQGGGVSSVAESVQASVSSMQI
ncbi:hypothetical protein [Methanosarcina acetivorans]|nr:hypothetical protein [Methanosarcina acetivorans]